MTVYLFLLLLSQGSQLVNLRMLIVEGLHITQNKRGDRRFRQFAPFFVNKEQ